MNKILKLKPFYSEKIWGYENWNLSTHKNGHSTIDNSEERLLDKLQEELPILIKVIQANDTLSVQVHPNNEYANKYENDNGKTECWYILDAKEDATLICGIKEGLDKNSLYKIIEDGNIEDYLKRIKVNKGDMIYIPSGTVHAIEGGIRLVEVQQSSDITYRMYDWGRDREMHIEKSLDVIDYEGINNGGKIDNFRKLVTPHFTVEKISVDSSYEDMVNENFHTYTVIGGSGSVVSGDDNISICEEDTIYIPNGVNYRIDGQVELLKSYV